MRRESTPRDRTCGPGRAREGECRAVGAQRGDLARGRARVGTAQDVEQGVVRSGEASGRAVLNHEAVADVADPVLRVAARLLPHPIRAADAVLVLERRVARQVADAVVACRPRTRTRPTTARRRSRLPRALRGRTGAPSRRSA